MFGMCRVEHSTAKGYGVGTEIEAAVVYGVDAGGMGTHITPEGKKEIFPAIDGDINARTRIEPEDPCNPGGDADAAIGIKCYVGFACDGEYFFHSANI